VPIEWIDIGAVQVAAQPVGLWTLAQDFVPGGRLLRISVLAHDHENQPVERTWKPAATLECGPDGILADTPRTSLLCTSALYGALIGKIGGATSDVPDLTPNAPPYANKRVFAAGSEVIVPLGTSDGGPLFLTMNDSPEGFAMHSGELLVRLQYYPT